VRETTQETDRVMDGLTVGLGLPPRPPRVILDRALETALAAGADAMWIIDHASSFIPQSIWDEGFSPAAASVASPDQVYEYQSVLGYAAAKAPGLRPAVGVTEAIRRHPAILAQAALTLSHLSDRRPILGLGAGERENLDPFGWPFDRPVSRLEEAVSFIRMCFGSSGPFDFEGEFYPARSAILDLEPGPAGVPEIWLAAHGPRTLAITGRLADGWYPTVTYRPPEYADALKRIRAAATAVGRDLTTFTPALQCMVQIAQSDDEAHRLLAAAPVRLWALLMPASRWAELGHSHPLGADHRGMVDFVPQHFDRAKIETALAAVPYEVLERSVFWGTVDSVSQDIARLVEAGLRHAVLVPVPGTVPEPVGSGRSVADLATRLMSGR
jgi:phthiodiolone/phenolphthiodiolone dimycocerosates ketoreductase